MLFFPDQNLGRWTGHKMGIPLEEMPIWDPDLPMGGLTEEAIKNAKVLLWKGHCAVHQMFRPQSIEQFRKLVELVNKQEELLFIISRIL